MCNGNEPGQPTPALLSGMARVKRRVSACPPLAGVGGGVALVKSHSTVYNTALLGYSPLKRVKSTK